MDVSKARRLRALEDALSAATCPVEGKLKSEAEQEQNGYIESSVGSSRGAADLES